MKIVQKANRQLRVDDVRAEELIKAGYVEIDKATGKPIVPETEAEKAQKVVAAMEQEIAALKQENEELKEQLDKLKVKAKKPSEGKEAEKTE